MAERRFTAAGRALEKTTLVAVPGPALVICEGVNKGIADANSARGSDDAQAEVGRRVDGEDRGKGEAPAIRDLALVTGDIVIDVEGPGAIGVDAVEAGEGNRIRTGGGVRGEGGWGIVSGGLPGTGGKTRGGGQGREGGVSEGQVDIRDRIGRAEAAASVGQKESRCAGGRDEEGAHVMGIGMGEAAEGGGDLGDLAGDAGDVDNGRVIGSPAKFGDGDFIGVRGNNELWQSKGKADVGRIAAGILEVEPGNDRTVGDARRQ